MLDSTPSSRRAATWCRGRQTHRVESGGQGLLIRVLGDFVDGALQHMALPVPAACTATKRFVVPRIISTASRWPWFRSPRPAAPPGPRRSGSAAGAAPSRSMAGCCARWPGPAASYNASASTSAPFWMARHLDGGLFLIQPARVHRGPDPCRARELGGLGHVHEMREPACRPVLLGLVERACRLVQRQLAHQAAVVLGRFHLGHDGADGGCGRSLGHGQFNQFFARE